MYILTFFQYPQRMILFLEFANTFNMSLQIILYWVVTGSLEYPEHHGSLFLLQNILQKYHLWANLLNEERETFYYLLNPDLLAS